MTDVTGKPRDRVRDLLAESESGLDAHEVARALDIHSTTARFHLINLVTDGDAVTVQLPPEGVGRPRVAYRIAPPAAAARLTQLLLMRLGDTPAARENAASDVGREWARQLGPAPQTSLPDPVIAVESTLTRLGVDVRSVTSELGRHLLTVCACELNDLAPGLPEVARGALRGAVDEALQGATDLLISDVTASVEPDPDSDCTLIVVLSG
ncbi:hypothetical protein JVX90_00840 [Gordonia sp. PDNC005]|uniref:hypothetical protein n=1 Tax=unclassified Gordonia (in: high G+C Gram-positive bacteria) TaxID=2657482 RepID=UPI0019624EF5|nr:hypothetical protein [Gordonia sp. PDNC005]QRY62850.1 hypothetical protein JVX90_00840 [Gordonia sp. PDNC005]